MASPAITAGQSDVNSPWSWHLDPATIGFPEITIEACQATPEYIEQTLDYWIGFGQVCISGFVLAPLESPGLGARPTPRARHSGMDGTASKNPNSTCR